MRKLKVLFHSDFALQKSGFGKNSRYILKYLYDTGKYDLVNFCCGITKTNVQLKRTPWLSIGAVPDDQNEVNSYINQFQPQEREARMRNMSYGEYNIDKIISEVKPDVYIGCQDIWGVDYCVDKPWFEKINSTIWTTLDSLPLLPNAVKIAPKIKNYWIWSSFATKEMHRLGHKHVKTMHGAVDENLFFKLEDHQRRVLRKLFEIPQDAFVIGFVFRNQLRKSVANLLEGYAEWKKRNPQIKNTYLLLHTHFSEGWDIPRIAKEYGVNTKEILTTFVCINCKRYQVKSFDSRESATKMVDGKVVDIPLEVQFKDCRCCGAKGNPGGNNQNPSGQITTNVGLGVTDEELCEIYNLMDVYVHPFTSGGQEIPCQEAKLCELPTLITNYSCGEENCEEGSGSIALDWNEYREFGTEFHKATTSPSSIAKQINRVYEMSKKEREKLGKMGREWAVKNFSIKSMGKQIEEFLDSCKPVEDYDFVIKSEEKSPNAVIPSIKDDGEFIIALYKEILKFKHINKDDDGYKHWMAKISQGMSRQEIEGFFRQTAHNENQKNHKVEFGELLDKNDKNRVLLVLPESIGDIFMATAILKSVRERYPKPDWTIYFATKPEYFELLDGNPYIDKVLHYIPIMDSLISLEGQGEQKGYFDIAYLLHANCQRFLTYLHNGKDTIDFKLE